MVILFFYPFFLFGERITDTPKPTEDIIAIEEPTGKSRINERIIPPREKIMPNIGEKIRIFLKS